MESKKEAGSLPEKDKSNSVCESCGEEFVCGVATNSCWCMDIKLTDQNREELKSKFETCLCRKCLRKINA